MNGFFHRLAWYFRRHRYETELKEELAFHRERATEDGVSDARRRLGNSAQLGEAARAEWAFRPVEELLQDLRYTFRVLRSRPGFALASMLTLALGVGATTALATVLDAVLLRPLPYHESQRLVQLLEVNIPRSRVLLYGVEATDSATFAAVGVVLAVVAGIAALVPTVRAGRIEPLVAMRA